MILTLLKFSLAKAGYSTRQIGIVLGISNSSVSRKLNGLVPVTLGELDAMAGMINKRVKIGKI